MMFPGMILIKSKWLTLKKWIRVTSEILQVYEQPQKTWFLATVEKYPKCDMTRGLPRIMYKGLLKW